MELKIGKMSSKELAQWLGISYSTYKNNIDKQLEKLTMYADFEKIYGGVNIKEIYIKEYDKNLNYKNDILFLKEIQTCNDSIATITGMTRKYEDYFEDIGQRSVRRQLTESRDRLFGKSNGLEPSKGVMGMREYIWAIKVSEMNEYRYLTKEENELFDALIKKVYGNVEPESYVG